MAAVILSAIVGDARAVIIETGDGTGNVTAPPDDPGWAYVGKRSNTTVVYIRNGFVLTANHVGVGQVTLDGVVYDDIPGTAFRFGNADLKVFSIWPSALMTLALLFSA